MVKKPFPFLRKGEGISRYGKIHYPIRVSAPATNLERATSSDDVTELSQAAVDQVDEVDEMSAEGDDAAPPREVEQKSERAVVPSTSGPIREQRPVEDWYSSESSRPSSVALSHDSEVSSSLDTREFELIEKMAAEFSLDSNDSLYQQLVFKQVKVRKTPLHSASSTGSSEDIIKAVAYLPEPHKEASVQVPRISRTEKPALLSAEEQTSSGTEDVDHLRLRPAPCGGTVQAQPFSLPVEQQRKLEEIVTQLERDATDIEKAKELLVKERAKLEEEKRDLEKANAEFCAVREQKLKSIEREKAFVRRQTNELKNRESDLVALLRQQISDLQSEVCDKEAKLSTFRSKTRLLDADMQHSRDECSALKLKCRNLEESVTRLEQENAQLRVKLEKAQSRRSLSSSESAGAANQPAKPSQTVLKSAQKRVAEKRGEKCVRFLLPEQDPIFTETEDRAVQANGAASPEKAMAPRRVFVNEPIPLVSLNALATDPACQLAKKFERIRPDGSTESIYKNGTVQEVSADGQVVTYHYANGDTRRFLADGSEVYYFGTKELTQIKYPSGVIVVKYKDGREETHYPDSKVDVRSPDGLQVSITPDGKQTELYPDGTVVEKTPDGVEVCRFPDGSKETRHRDFLRREFPNGDVKFKYADGTEETRYASGRVRVKSCDGSILRDEIPIM